MRLAQRACRAAEGAQLPQEVKPVHDHFQCWQRAGREGVPGSKHYQNGHADSQGAALSTQYASVKLHMPACCTSCNEHSAQ